MTAAEIILADTLQSFAERGFKPTRLNVIAALTDLGLTSAQVAAAAAEFDKLTKVDV